MLHFDSFLLYWLIHLAFSIKSKQRPPICRSCDALPVFYVILNCLNKRKALSVERNPPYLPARQSDLMNKTVENFFQFLFGMITHNGTGFFLFCFLVCRDQDHRRNALNLSLIHISEPTR